MRDTNISALWKSTVKPHYSLIGIHDLNLFNADVKLHVERNSDQNIAINRQDPSFGLGWQREFERGQFGIRFGYDKSSSRSTTLEEIGRASGGDSTRTNKSIGVNLQYVLAERVSLSSSANISRMTFQGGGATGGGSSAYAASASLNYLYSEFLQPYLQVTANRSEPDEVFSSATNVYSTVVGANWALFEKMNLGANWGYNQTTGATCGRGWQAAGNLSYIFEKSSLNMVMSRSISPSANGGFISSDQISGGWRYDLSDRSSAGIDASMRKNHGEGKSESSQFSTWYARELNPDWNLRLSYLHKQSVSTDQQAHNNVLGMSINYKFSNF